MERKLHMKEIELKLQIIGELSWENILSYSEFSAMILPNSYRAEQLTAKYYDTPTGSLSKDGLVYRTRMENNTWIGTIKSNGCGSGGLHQREEWQVEQEDGKPNLQAFRHFRIAETITSIPNESLGVILATTFSREKCLLQGADGSIIEFAMDKGQIEAGEKQEPISEIELELKKGKVTQVLKIGGMLASKYPLLLQSQSKFGRGITLLGGRVKDIRSVSLNRDDAVNNALTHMVCNSLFGLAEGHQELVMVQSDNRIENFGIQVSILRSLVTFAKKQMQKKVFNDFDEWVKQLIVPAEKLREINVLMNVWKQSKQAVSDFERMCGLDDILEKQKKTEIEQLKKVCNPCIFTPYLIQLWAMLLEGIVFFPSRQSLGKYVEEWMMEAVETFQKEIQKETDHLKIEDLYELRKQSTTIRNVLDTMQGSDFE